jgi:hypothetical protein
MADFGDVIDQARLTDQWSDRTGSIIRFIWHHQGGTSDDYTIGLMVNHGKVLSATYTVNNDNPDGRGWSRITGVAPERYRPWTSDNSAADGRALTAEVANSSGDPDWGIADETHEACARIAAYAYREYGVPLKRATVDDPSGHLGHNEVTDMFGGGYSTFCPGHLDIDLIIVRASQLVGRGLTVQSVTNTSITGDDDMTKADIDAIQSKLDLIANTQNFQYPFQAFRCPAITGPHAGAVDLMAPGIDWHVPNVGWLGILQGMLHLCGPVQDVPDTGDGGNSMFAWLQQFYLSLAATVDSAAIAAQLDTLVSEHDISNVTIPEVVSFTQVDIAKITAANTDGQSKRNAP